jgi:hypothetical protein
MNSRFVFTFGFQQQSINGTDKGFASARQAEIEEFIYRLA